jgi:uncharacterized glyoxalase superfamily protein PhnB
MHNIIQKQITDITDILRQLSPSEYAQELSLLNGSSIGKHIRHIIEFYEALFTAQKTKKLCYDHRERKMILEDNLSYTLHFLEEMKEQCILLAQNVPLVMEAQYDKYTYEVNTSLHREIIYNIEHTVHHLAIIRIALMACFPDVRIPENFGYAASTIQFQEKIQA